MSYNEIITAIIAILAIIIILYANRTSRKTQEQANKLQKEANQLQLAQARLAQKQLEMTEKEDIENNRIKIKLELIKSGESHKFILKNISNIEAYNVNLLIHPNNDLLVDEKEKLPIKILSPSSNVPITAFLGDASAFNATISWTDKNGLSDSVETYVAI
ncbi:hypothetical protein [Aeromonas veronii]|uniref:hypothetical protein n=1 Tax=Aeromonas veronii TaxID=654 RepID=UPI002B48AEF2|nr:hypothetical protein [Aeromonas veronii]